MSELKNMPPNERAKAIQERHQELLRDQPGLRARNAAEEIGISEAELLVSRDDRSVIHLDAQPEQILSDLVQLGEVMALTRNESCVHERKGVYEGAQFFTHGKRRQGLFVNPDIDLRLFMSHWAFAFAVIEETKSGNRRSFQFFDKSGTAVHKVYLTNKSKLSAFENLIGTYRATSQPLSIDTEPYDEEVTEKISDDQVDWNSFRTRWENLKDTHDFFPLLKKFKLDREQAFRRIGKDFAYEVENDASERILRLARDTECEIMVFVGNRGCIQIHTGPVKKLIAHDCWYNVLDPMFNLHLNQDQIARTWVTRKPTVDGHVTAIEVFDANGALIVTFFGKRKPGVPELELWREIVSAIPAKEIADVA